MNKDTVTVECSFKRETDSAILISTDEDDFWIPLSQVESIHRDPTGNGHIIISSWIAEQKGL